MRLIANRQLTGTYGTVVNGQEFDVDEEVARELLRSGVVRKPGPPRILYDTKVVIPEAPAVGARLPFRNCPVHNPEPAPVAPEGDQMLPAADIPEVAPGTPDTVGRRGRGRPRTVR